MVIRGKDVISLPAGLETDASVPDYMLFVID